MEVLPFRILLQKEHNYKNSLEQRFLWYAISRHDLETTKRAYEYIDTMYRIQGNARGDN